MKKRRDPQREIDEHLDKAIDLERAARRHESAGEPITAEMFRNSAKTHRAYADAIRAELEREQKQVAA